MDPINKALIDPIANEFAIRVKDLYVPVWVEQPDGSRVKATEMRRIARANAQVEQLVISPLDDFSD